MKRSENAKSDAGEMTVLRGITGLWWSGLYGIGFGMLAGMITGAAVGTIVPIIGNLVGGVIGAFAGAIVGLPAGIIGAGLGGVQGWRIAGAASVFAVGLAVLWLIGCADSQTLVPSIPWWLVLAYAGCVQVGFWSGGTAFHRLEYGDGFYDKWRQTLHEKGVETLSDTLRARCLVWALLPVALLYSSVFAAFLFSRP